MSAAALDFAARSALRPKSTWELARALAILSVCSNDLFVRNASQVMKMGRKVLGRRAFRALVKPTFYRQFVGGETPAEFWQCVQQLRSSRQRLMLAATYEETSGPHETWSESLYFKNCAKILECLELTAEVGGQEPMMQIKLTGIISPNLLVKLGKVYEQSNKIKFVEELANNLNSKNFNMPLLEEALTETEQDKLHRGLGRLAEIGYAASRLGIKLLVDAETTDVNPGISALALALMANFNFTFPQIWNTYQCYLKSTPDTVVREHQLCRQLGVGFGAKVVRGAYLVQESALPVSPLWGSYEETCLAYDRVIRRLLEHAAALGPERFQMVAATHNEKSILAATKGMKELGLTKGVMFGQLFGMSDQVSNVLAQAGYTVYKSIPYGPLETVLPYLSRRAAENSSVLGGSRRERELLWTELRHRFGLFPPREPAPLPAATSRM